MKRNIYKIVLSLDVLEMAELKALNSLLAEMGMCYSREVEFGELSFNRKEPPKEEDIKAAEKVLLEKLKPSFKNYLKDLKLKKKKSFEILT